MSAELPPVVHNPDSAPDRFLAALPAASASKPHIWLLIALWVVLVPVTLIWPHLVPLPIALALGNHTNIVSAVGSSIAAGVSTANHHQVRAHNKAVLSSLDALHAKVDDQNGAD